MADSRPPHPQLEASPNDQRKYRQVELANGLQVLLVEDPNALHSAASMAVNAGHFQDPEDAQGLAHFLEHMLFMGTSSAPSPDTYPDFISHHGGHHNAWTGTEHTNFHFDVRPDYFDGALNYFSQLFICPLFDLKWIEKELQSVEAEYRMKLKDELRRLYQVHKETANPAHPFTKFSVGNAETLAGCSQRPIAEHLKAFFERWYHATNMRLVLVGPQDLDTLSALASQHFNAIRSDGHRPASIAQPLYLESQQGVVIHVRPLKSACRMILTLPFPGIDDDYANKTTTLIAHILGYEGPGSLCSLLKAQGLASDLSAGGGISGSNFKDFNFNIQLTERGLERYLDVCQLVFQAIDDIRRQPLADFHYAERQQMVALSFRYQEAIRSIDLASQLSINMLHYAPEHVISGDYLMQGVNHQRLQQLLNAMRPEHARIMLIHHSLPVNQTTQLYETAYRVTPLAQPALDQLKQRTDYEIELPQANPFVPQRLDPLPLRGGRLALPQLLPSSPALQVWHLQDADFRMPKGHIYLSLLLPQATHSKEAFAHARVWCELVHDKLNEQCYDAEVAGIHFNIYPQQSGISIHLSGFSERQPELLARILKALTNFEFDDDRFNNIQHHLYHNWLAVNRHKPINHLFTVLNQTLQRGCYIGSELASELKQITTQSFADYMPTLFNQMNVLAMIHGDWPVDTAQRITQLITRELELNNRSQQAPLREVKLLQPGRAESIDCHLPHPDHAIAFFSQGQALNDAEKAYYLLLNHLVSPGFFSELRTEQQLGYMVGTSYVPMNGRPGLLFYVQSPHAGLDTMRAAISKFLQDFCQQLASVPQPVWEGAKRSVIEQLTDQDPSLRIRAQRLWTSIGIEDYQFDLAQRMADKVAETTIEQLVDVANDRLLSNAAAMWLTCSPTASTTADNDDE
ncbi:MAG: insulinase family protein [Idiomarina sp.]|nr:insulinase family protein [Idiomarina sp.]